MGCCREAAASLHARHPGVRRHRVARRALGRHDAHPPGAGPAHARERAGHARPPPRPPPPLVMRATVLDIHSYWNADHTLILTDVRARPGLVLKGSAAGDVTFTVMGGTVGAVTTLIVGGADLAPGSEDVMFLAPAAPPAPPHRLTIRDHAQGVFDIVNGRAFSQALADPLLPDAQGETAAPGGEQGLALDDLVHQVHAQSNR